MQKGGDSLVSGLPGFWANAHFDGDAAVPTPVATARENGSSLWPCGVRNTLHVSCDCLKISDVDSKVGEAMKPELKQLIEGKRKWTEPPSPEETERGFKGWYASKNLPHFDGQGTQQFITYRLRDSLPAERRSEWEIWLKLEDDREKRKRMEAYLDRGLGACHLRQTRVAELAQGNLWHHDGVMYRLLAWVIMPNHVHALIEIWRVPLGKILHAWKSYTAKEANRILGREGTFWAEDYFDRYIRDEEHLRRAIRYIENNPVKAGLVRASEDWPWSSARYRSRADLSGRTLTHPAAQRLAPA